MKPRIPTHRVRALAIGGCLLMLSSAAQAELPTTLGWYELPNTKIADVCAGTHGFPSILGGTGCSAITGAWNSGAFDTLNNRLVVWGGGHNDYIGNELYGLDLDDLSMARLNDPSTQVPSSCGVGTTGDNQANSRHTYDHIIHMSHAGRMFVFGGASAPCGFFTNDTWTFSYASMSWQKMNASGPIPEGNYGRVTGYNPKTKLVYIADQTTLFSYDFDTNAYEALADHTIGQTQTGVVDTKRELFLMIGGGQVMAYHVDAASTFVGETWSTTGGSPIVNADNPGVAYDPVSDRVVAWSGGNTVYTLNTETKAWTAVSSFTGGPGSALGNGTFKRWAYSAKDNVFVVVNSVDDNAFAFRLTAGAGAHQPPSPPTNLVVE